MSGGVACVHVLCHHEQDLLLATFLICYRLGVVHSPSTNISPSICTGRHSLSRDRATSKEEATVTKNIYIHRRSAGKREREREALTLSLSLLDEASLNPTSQPGHCGTDWVRPAPLGVGWEGPWRPTVARGWLAEPWSHCEIS